MLESLSKKYLPEVFRSNFKSKYLIMILAAAAILRLPGIFWGIPVFDSMVQNYHPDEPKIINGAVNFPHHIFTNNDLRYPTFYHYLIGTLSIPVKLIYKITGPYEENFQIFVSLFARFISIILAAGSVFLSFLLAKKLYDEKTALLSALFLSFSFYHVQNSSWATLDAANSFFFALTALAAYNSYENPSLKSYMLTGISLGLLTGTKYNGFTAAVLILILHFSRSLNIQKKFSTIFKAAFSKKLWLLFFTAGIVFILTTPGIILKPDAFNSSISELFNVGAGKKYNAVWDLSFYLSIIKNYIAATDPFLTIAFIAGLIFPLHKSWDKEFPLIFAVLIFLFLFGALGSRQIIAVLPLTSILGAQALFYLYKRITFAPKPAWIFFFVFWIAFEIVYNCEGILERANDTRTMAAYYVEKNIVPGSSVGAASIGNYKRWSWMMPRIDAKKFQVADPLDKPDYIILSSYDYERMEKAFSSGKLHNYIWTGFSAEWYKNQIPSPQVFLFYENVLMNKGKMYNYKLIQKFEKRIFTPIEFPPPQIRIYKRNDNFFEPASGQE